MLWTLILIAFSQLYLALPLQAQEQAKKPAADMGVAAPAAVTAPKSASAPVSAPASAPASISGSAGAPAQASASASLSKNVDSTKAKRAKLKGEQPDPNLAGYRRIGDFGLNPKKTVGPFPNKDERSAFGRPMAPMTATPSSVVKVLKGAGKDKKSGAHTH
ncbi:MAG: hypothetical protein SFV17_04310 [Candidatus Obscuribacter sp.]|nr:hypothetical protein [Candidatus Obscuribacter sp.]